ncbi:MAG TPA: glyoxalase [Bacteroidales bacterium]|nr:MAG: glyoxalase [Bacteroidetes bacterium GWE2_42_24]OFY28126.1 MAG: glyoxalase [Bacteroidetes bacterium GWF2_43_11]HAQ64556.1 glyoxalase [Bacteroidales bacterium]HBZ65506.1 glyoxalase [Bacteroidales bacterium]
MIIKQILTRICVNEINQTIDFYERLTNEKCSNRFEYKKVGLELAVVGNFLVIAGSEEALIPFRSTTVTFLVDSVNDYKTFLNENGATILRDIQPVPTGFNMTVMHNDGVIVEYVEHRKV